MPLPANTEAYFLTFNSTGVPATCRKWKRACLLLRRGDTDSEIADELEKVAKQIRTGQGDRIRFNDELFESLLPFTEGVGDCPDNDQVDSRTLLAKEADLKSETPPEPSPNT